MSHVFKHPKYYTELRKRNKTDQAISSRAETSGTSVRPDPGHKPQAASDKLQAASDKPTEPQASSGKLQASSNKLQAPSHKRQAP
jgi:hypothetical protein